jgi:fructan beta-fructosidase
MHSLRWNILLILIAAQSLTAQDNGLTAYWHFDSSTGTAAIESRKQVEDKIQGNFSCTPGVRGDGIKFDGFTTRISRDSKAAPEIHEALTFETWIAPQAYPWNWNAIVAQKNRYFFGVDATGPLGLRVPIDDQWRECICSCSLDSSTADPAD